MYFGLDGLLQLQEGCHLSSHTNCDMCSFLSVYVRRIRPNVGASPAEGSHPTLLSSKFHAQIPHWQWHSHPFWTIFCLHVIVSWVDWVAESALGIIPSRTQYTKCFPTYPYASPSWLPPSCVRTPWARKLYRHQAHPLLSSANLSSFTWTCVTVQGQYASLHVMQKD